MLTEIFYGVDAKFFELCVSRKTASNFNEAVFNHARLKVQ